MSSPVVIQGKPVNQPIEAIPTTGGTSGDWNGRGEKQETRCRDPIFAILFYICVLAIVGMAATMGPGALSSGNHTTTNGGKTFEYNGYVAAAGLIALISFVASGVGVAILMCIPETIIKVSLILSIIMSVFVLIVAIMSGAILGIVLGAVMLLLTLCYVRAVWSRIPFASANLVTSCTAIKGNLGVMFFAYVFTIVAGVWSITWSVAFVGVYSNTSECEAGTNKCDSPNYALVFILLVAFYFIQQVLQVCARLGLSPRSPVIT